MIFATGRYDMNVGQQPYCENCTPWPAATITQAGHPIQILGQGSTIECHGFDITYPYDEREQYYPGAFRFEGCTGLYIDGFTFTMKRLPFTQGTVWSVINLANEKSFEFQPDPGFSLPANVEDLRIRRTINFDASTGRPGKFITFELKKDALPVGQFTVSPVPASNRIKITANNTAGNLLWARILGGYIQPSEKLTLCHAEGAAGDCLSFDSCDGVTIRSTQVHGWARGMSSVNSRNFDIDGFVIDRAPNSSHLTSTTTDGIHLVHTSGFMKLTGTRIERTTDDGLNMYTRLWKVHAWAIDPVTGDDVVVVEQPKRPNLPATWSPPLFEPGDTLEFYQSDLSISGSPWTIQAPWTPEPDGPNGVKRYKIRILGGSVTPTNGYWVANLGGVPSTVTIAGCDFSRNVRHGIMLHTRNTTVSATFRYQTGPAIEVCADNLIFFEGPPPENVTIDSCTIEDCNDGHPVANQQIAAIHARVLNVGQTLPATSPISDLTLKSVTLRRTPLEALRAAAVSNILVESCTFENVANDTTNPVHPLTHFLSFFQVTGNVRLCNLSGTIRPNYLKSQAVFTNNQGFGAGQ